LVALLALRKANVDLKSSRLRKLLHDEDSEIRRMTMIWLGEASRMELANDVRQSMKLQTVAGSVGR
jgi:hypothetical protein